jgi:hypothetical protein
VTRRRLVLATLVVELTVLAFSWTEIRDAGDNMYWWLWSVVPLPDGVERPHRPPL